MRVVFRMLLLFGLLLMGVFLHLTVPEALPEALSKLSEFVSKLQRLVENLQ